MLSCSVWFSAPSFWMGGAFCTLFYLVASSWHFTLFHEEDARSNNPQMIMFLVKTAYWTFCVHTKKKRKKTCISFIF